VAEAVASVETGTLIVYSLDAMIHDTLYVLVETTRSFVKKIHIEDSHYSKEEKKKKTGLLSGVRFYSLG
jgi:hypothetical protein